MNIQQLTCFRTVALLKSFSKAAGVLALSRSGVNQNIKDLEEELSVTLFYYKDGEIELTQYGEILLPYADRLFNIFDDVKSTISGMKMESSKVKICYSGTLANTIFPILFKSLYDEKILEPESVEMIFTPILDDVKEKLDSGEADVAFFIERPSRNFKFIPIAKDQLYIILPATHPLAARDKLSLTDLRDEIYVAPSINNYNHDSYLQAAIDQMFSSENIHPKYSDYSALLPYRFYYVLAENGYTISPMFPLDKRLKAVEIDNPYCKRDIYMIWPKSRKASATTCRLLDYCKIFFKDKVDMTYQEIAASMNREQEESR